MAKHPEWADDPEWTNDPEWSGTGVESRGRSRGDQIVYEERSTIEGREHLFETLRRGIEAEPERFGLKGPRKVREAERRREEVKLDDVDVGVTYFVLGGTVHPLRIEIKSGGTVREDRGQQRPSPELEHATLPGAEEASRPVRSMIVRTPEESEERIFAEFSAYAQAYPQRSKEFAEQLMHVVDQHRPLGTRRVLGMADAIRITGLSEARIKQIAGEGRIGEKHGKRWAFSEEELVRLATIPRKSGRPTKNISENR